MAIQSSLHRRLARVIASGQSAIKLDTRESGEALTVIAELCKQFQWNLFTYKINTGLEGHGMADPSNHASAKIPGLPADIVRQNAGGAEGAMAAMRSLLFFDNQHYHSDGKQIPSGDGDVVPTVLVLVNAHRLMSLKFEVVQWFLDLVKPGKEQKKHIILLSPKGAKYPPEIEPVVTTIVHAEPTPEEHMEILDQIHIGDKPIPLKRQRHIAEAAKGLTRGQLENHAAEQAVATSDVDPDKVWEFKVELFDADGLLTIHKPEGGLSKMGGMKFYREDLVKLMKKGIAPKILAAGPPGVGKSAGAFAIGYDAGLNVLIANLGKLFQKYVGESEGRSRDMMEMIERNAPCVVVLDELPRFISTDGSGHGSDVSAKVGGEWLTWLSSKRAQDVTIIATANEWSGVGTLVREERFNFNLYTSIHMQASKSKAIWDLYLKEFGVDPNQEIPPHKFWTGGEIKACCKKASAGWFDEPLVVAALRRSLVR